MTDPAVFSVKSFVVCYKLHWIVCLSEWLETARVSFSRSLVLMLMFQETSASTWTKGS